MLKPSEPHPWFRPLWRRLLTFAICLGWLVFEIVQQDPFWLMVAALAVGYAVWEFFLSPTYRKPGKAE